MPKLEEIVDGSADSDEPSSMDQVNSDTETFKNSEDVAFLFLRFQTLKLRGPMLTNNRIVRSSGQSGEPGNSATDNTDSSDNDDDNDDKDKKLLISALVLAGIFAVLAIPLIMYVNFCHINMLVRRINEKLELDPVEILTTG